LITESTILTILGVILGAILVYAGLTVLTPLLDSKFGLSLEIEPPSPYEIGILGAIIVAGVVAGCIPAWRAYKASLADGMTIRS